MSATTGSLNGTLVALHIDESGTLKKVANLMSNDLDISIDMIDVSSKSSGGWKEFIVGDKGGQFSFSAVMEEDGSVGTDERSFSDLYTLAVAGTAFTLVFTSAVVGDKKYYGSCYLSNLKVSSPYNDKVTFTGTGQVTGALSVATVS